MSEGSRDATFAASFGLREILSAIGVDTTIGSVDVDVVFVEVPVPDVFDVPSDVEPDVAPVVVVDECFDVLASAFAVDFASFVSALAVAFAFFVVVFAALASTLVVGLADAVGPPLFADLTCWPPCPAADVLFIVGAFTGFGGFAEGAAGFGAVILAGLVAFGPAVSVT